MASADDIFAQIFGLPSSNSSQRTQTQRTQGDDDDDLDLADLLLGRRSAASGSSPRGEDLLHNMKVSLEDLYTGKTSHLAVSRKRPCPGCNGRGRGSVEKCCSDCSGRGIRVFVRQIGPSILQQLQQECGSCNGHGKVRTQSEICSSCRGTKVFSERKLLEVKIEKGARNGERIKFRGEADEIPGSNPGDIIIVVQEKEHEVFKRNDANLQYPTIEVTAYEVQHGFTKEITHLNGRTVRVQVDAGEIVSQDQVKVIEGEGMPVAGSSAAKGNLILQFKAELPRGEDLVHPYKASLEDLYGGKTARFAVNRSKPCPDCAGRGAVKIENKCSDCSGHGKVSVLRQLGPGLIQQATVACPSCRGSGKFSSNIRKCSTCDGTKTIKERRVLEINIEKGMKQGAEIRFRGEADEAPGTVAGDVVIVIHEKEHDVFKRIDDNLFYSTIAVSATEVQQGFTKEITHLDGRKVKVQMCAREIVRQDQMKVIDGEGMPIRGRPNAKGKLSIKFRAEFPRGEDLVHSYKVSLEDLYNGKTGHLAVYRKKPCMACDSPAKLTAQTGIGSNTCSPCNGSKVLKDRKVLDLTIEKGMKQGSEIRFCGEADEIQGTTPGDVVIVVSEKEHDIFKRKNADLYYPTFDVSTAEVQQGFTKEITHLDGRKVRVQIRPGELTTQDPVKVIEGEGMPLHGSGVSKGNMLLQFNINGFTHTEPVRTNTNLQAIGEVEYRGVIALVNSFEPPNSCQQHMCNELASLMPAINMTFILRESSLIAESRLERLKSSSVRLSYDEALAVVSYTYDLGINSTKNGDDNLFMQLNNILRERNAKKMALLKPYLAYLMNGLFKLPSFEGTVYRGIPNAALRIIQDSYIAGASIHWSGFSSATTDINIARGFADKGGIIFHILCHTGRMVSEYSHFKDEAEIMLSPNSRFVVCSVCRLHGDGFYRVELVEARTETVLY
jgi:DnaJ-class molecular chaperone